MWLAGHTTEHNNRVGQEAFGLVHLGIYQSVACVKKEDKNKDTPSHGKARKSGAQLVVLHRCPYFLEKFYHFMYPFMPNGEAL
jgi:hypothetical protein